jgi:cytoskeleton protein RodZ
MTAVLNDISEGPAPEPVHNQDQDRAPKQGQTLGQSLGDLLRSKREALGMSVQQAAEQLRLLPHWIEAFESNRFDSLVAPVYSRGYLRKYAILLELPPEEILARYERLHDIPATPPLAPIKPTASPPIRTSRAPAWLGATAFVSVAAVLVFTRMEQDANQANGEPPQQVATMTVATPPVAPAPTAAVPAPEASAVEAAATTDAAAVPISNTEGGTPMDAAAPATGTDAAAIAPPADPALTPVSAESPPAAPQTSSEPAPAAEEAAAEPEEPLARLEVPLPRNGRNLNLKLSFKGKSWATVYAADGTRLLYELGRRGRPRSLTSAAPLTVVVGAIDAVDLRVNDKPVTIPRQPGKDSIKFILDVESSTRDARSAADVGSGG